MGTRLHRLYQSIVQKITRMSFTEANGLPSLIGKQMKSAPQILMQCPLVTVNQDPFCNFVDKRPADQRTRSPTYAVLLSGPPNGYKAAEA
jgi:hypothetical protein